MSFASCHKNIKNIEKKNPHFPTFQCTIPFFLYVDVNIGVLYYSTLLPFHNVSVEWLCLVSYTNK